MLGFIIGLFAGGFLGVFVMCLCNVASRVRKRKARIKMARMIENELVDKEHKIEFSELNATLYFLKESEKNGIKDAEGLLLDAYEQRMCA